MFPKNMSSSMYNTRYLGLATFAINSAVHCLSLSAHKNICFYFCSTSVWIRSNTAALQADPWSSQQFIHKIMPEEAGVWNNWCRLILINRSEWSKINCRRISIVVVECLHLWMNAVFWVHGDKFKLPIGLIGKNAYRFYHYGSMHK